MTEVSWDATDVKVVEGRTYALNQGTIQEINPLDGAVQEMVWESGLINLPSSHNFHFLLVRAEFSKTIDTLTGGWVGAIGGSAIGDVGCPPVSETLELEFPVKIESFDRRGRALFEPRIVTDEQPYTINMGGQEHDVFCLRVTSRAVVQRVSLASEAKDFAREVK